MIDTLIFLLIFCAFYFVKFRLYINIFDPLQLASLSEALIAFAIFRIEHIGPLDRILMGSILVFYLGAWAVFALFMKETYFKAITRVGNRLECISKTKVYILLLAVFIVTLFLFLTSKWLGLSGDNRLVLTKILRPLEGFWVFGFQVVVLAVLLKSPKTMRTAYFLLCLITLLLTLVLGKGFIFNAFLPFSIYLHHFKIKISALRAVIFYSFAVLMMSIGFIYSNGVSLNGLIQAFIYRILNDSDVYLLGFSEGVVDSLNLTSFVTYVFGPFFKLVGLGSLVDYNVGAQIGSFYAGRTVTTGPNAQLPYLAIVYFESFFYALINSCAVICLWFYVKVFLLKYNIRGVGPISFSMIVFFALAFPQTVIKDPPFASSFLIVMLSAILIKTFCFSVVRLIFRDVRYV